MRPGSADQAWLARRTRLRQRGRGVIGPRFVSARAILTAQGECHRHRLRANGRAFPDLADSPSGGTNPGFGVKVTDFRFERHDFNRRPDRVDELHRFWPGTGTSQLPVE